jgi:aromatic-L-amino-acid/L-tryptophan decarboxylase
MPDPMPPHLSPEEIRDALHRTADLVADYLTGSERYPVLPAVEPGEIWSSFADEAPEEPVPMDHLLDVYRERIEPAVTQWNHPGFMAYFAITATAPTVAGEALSAALNVNSMLWRTGPAPTEMEYKMCDWLRRLWGLPEDFVGHLVDTASTATLVALAAARHRHDPEVRRRGSAGRPPLVLYASEQTHSSVDKAAVVLGVGLDQVRRLPVDERFRLRPDALAAAVAEDRAAGLAPFAVVATAGSTSTTAVDPLPEIADLCAEHGLWLHVDAAYAGNAAVCPELRAHLTGWERADSIVVNPYKWSFLGFDGSVLLVRDVDELRHAFSVVPEYLKTSFLKHGGGEAGDLPHLMDLGFQLGRRFRALKLWMGLSAMGAGALRSGIRRHVRLAAELARRVDEDPRFERMAPAPFGTVCLRGVWDGPSEEETDTRNERLMERVNDAGPVLLSHTRLGPRFVIRVVFGHGRTGEEELETVWRLLAGAHDALSPGSPST